jgi:type VI protein secretion system component Hcp
MQIIREQGSGKPVTVEGETEDAEFPGACDLNSFSLGVASGVADEEEDEDSGNGTETVKSSGRGVRSSSSKRSTPSQGRIGELDNFTFSVAKQVDTASTELMKAFCYGKTSRIEHQQLGMFEKVIVTLRKSTGKKQACFMQFNFYECYVKGYRLNLSSTDSDGTPDEDIDFVFSACQVKYWKQLEDGRMNNVPKEMYFDFNKLAESSR